MSRPSRNRGRVVLLISAALCAFAGVSAAERGATRGHPGPGYGMDSRADVQIYSDYESEYWPSN